MFALLLPILAVVFNSIKIDSQILCANEDTYCLPGLGSSDFNRGVSTRYISAGTINNCTYFQTALSPSSYLYKHVETGYWIVAANMTDNTYRAFCNEAFLDDCIQGKWVYFDGVSAYYHSNLRIEY